MNRSTTGPTEDATAPVDELDRGSQPVLEVLSTTFSGPGTAVGPVCVCAPAWMSDSLVVRLEQSMRCGVCVRVRRMW